MKLFGKRKMKVNNMKNEMVSIDRGTLGELLAAQEFLIKDLQNCIEQEQSGNLKDCLNGALRWGIATYNRVANLLDMSAYKND